MSFFDKPAVSYAVLLGLVILAFYVGFMRGKVVVPEGFVPSQTYTSGADLRFATRLTATDQKPYEVERNADKFQKNEHMSNNYSQEEVLANQLYGIERMSPDNQVESELAFLGRM